MLRARRLPGTSRRAPCEYAQALRPNPKDRSNRRASSAAAGPWDGAPLAAGAEDVHEAVDDLAHLDMTSIAAALSRRNQRLDMRPFGVGQIARVAEPAASAASAVFVAPHYRRRSELMRSIHDVIRVSPLRRERGRGPWPPDGLESTLSPLRGWSYEQAVCTTLRSNAERDGCARSGHRSMTSSRTGWRTYHDRQL